MAQAHLGGDWFLSCPHCGPQFIESVEHKSFDCPLAQKMWRYAANIIWQLFSKKRKLGSQKSYWCNAFLTNLPTTSWHITKMFQSHLVFVKVFHGLLVVNEIIWFLKLSLNHWRKHTKLCEILVWYVGLSGNVLSMTWKKPPDIVYQDIRNKFDLVWCINSHGWALLLEVLSFAQSPKAVVLFTLQLIFLILNIIIGRKWSK